MQHEEHPSSWWSSSTSYCGTSAVRRRDVSFLVVAIVATAVLVRWRPAAKALGAVGQQTLPIYVLHPLMIYAAVAIGPTNDLAATIVANPVGALLYPLASVAAIAAASLVVHRGLLRARMVLLFEMPVGWRTRLLGKGVADPRIGED